MTTTESIKKQIKAGQFEEASRALDATLETDENRCELLMLRGRLKEMSHDRPGAFAFYQQVLEHDPEHREAMFRAAYVADLCGDDGLAIELYERCVAGERAPVSAMVNLAVLYEERGELQNAEAALQSVLEEHPNSFRAKDFLKSVRCSYTMMFDDKTQRNRERHGVIMDVPIADFELSVRSRNCLRQMNLRTIGDLLKVTESELLSYKNFGETSLSEIKAMLSQRGLKLGQALQPVEPPVLPPALRPPADGSAYLKKPCAELELSVRARKCLQMLNVTTLEELAARTEQELLTMKNFGQTSLNEIKKQLANYGLSFRSSE